MSRRIAPTKLSNWPWIVVRLDCVLCRRRGCYRLARLAARYGPEQSMDGLLRDLAHDCPWWNERPRKYEPRCGVRFTDLDHALPPPDHPEEPIFRQRQPGREDLPKRQVQDRLSTVYAGRGPTLGGWPDAELTIACHDCGRCEVFAITELRARMPAETMLVNLRVTLSADCPKRQGPHSVVQCGALIVRLEHNRTPGE